jgi:trehalose synthase
MNRVPTQEKRLDDYTGIISSDLISEVLRTAEKLKGIRIVHINATADGGGVAEILKSLVPLMCDVGIEAEWYVLKPEDSFFNVSKTLHHCLQGASTSPCPDDMQLYRQRNDRAAGSLATMGVTADLWLIHDAQVLPLLSYLESNNGAWICHVDTTNVNKDVWGMLVPYLTTYQRVVASMPEYISNGNSPCEVSVFPPAIDPLLPKHKPLAFAGARNVLASLGMDPARPIISQLSRFDRWKDPWGVIDAYRLAKKEMPDLQVALVGAMTAKDDADAWEVLASVQEHGGDDPDIHLFSDPQVIGDLQVNAFQSGSDIVLQKSIREGFGLTVAEAMWKGRPVIGGNCGGIKLQICDGVTGYLVGDISSCADRILALLKNPALMKQMGESARESVRKSYLMPRLLRDYLRLAATLLDGKRDPTDTRIAQPAVNPK